MTQAFTFRVTVQPRSNLVWDMEPPERLTLTCDLHAEDVDSAVELFNKAIEEGKIRLVGVGPDLPPRMHVPWER